MSYKPYSPEWHRKRYLKEALDKYLDDYVDNDVIYNDILDVLEERAELAHAEYNRVSELETKLRRSTYAIYTIPTAIGIHLQENC